MLYTILTLWSMCLPSILYWSDLLPIFLFVIVLVLNDVCILSFPGHVHNDPHIIRLFTSTGGGVFTPAAPSGHSRKLDQVSVQIRGLAHTGTQVDFYFFILVFNIGGRTNARGLPSVQNNPVFPMSLWAYLPARRNGPVWPYWYKRRFPRMRPQY